MTFRFVSRRVVEEIHKRQIERFGGALGLRDDGLLESALARPINKVSYGCEDVYEVAAAYLYGLIKNHPFIDGNKRIAIGVTAVFLQKNGFRIDTTQDALYDFVYSVAEGKIGEAGAALILSRITIPLG